MSSLNLVYVGSFLRILKKKTVLGSSLRVSGCKKCQITLPTTMFSKGVGVNFCPTCGTQKSTFETKHEVMYPDGDILSQKTDMGKYFCVPLETELMIVLVPRAFAAGGYGEELIATRFWRQDSGHKTGKGFLLIYNSFDLVRKTQLRRFKADLSQTIEKIKKISKPSKVSVEWGVVNA